MLVIVEIIKTSGTACLVKHHMFHTLHFSRDSMGILLTNLRLRHYTGQSEKNYIYLDLKCTSPNGAPQHGTKFYGGEGAFSAGGGGGGKKKIFFFFFFKKKKKEKI